MRSFFSRRSSPRRRRAISRPIAQPARPASLPRTPRRLGTYDLEITTDDGTLLGSLSLKRANDALVAELVAGANRPAVKSFVREGNGYVLTGGHGSSSSCTS